MEPLLRQTPLDNKKKRDIIERNSHDTKILVMGSSHAACDIDPSYFSEKAINIALLAQSVSLDYFFLNKYKDRFDSLKYIVIPISYHSLYYEMGMLEGQEATYKYYDIYFGTDFEKNPLKKMLIFNGVMKDNLLAIKKYYIDKDTINPNMTELGLIKNAPAKSIENIRKSAFFSAKRHNRKNLNLGLIETNTNYYKEIIKIARAKNVKIILFTPPLHPLYRDLLDKYQLNQMYDAANSLKNNSDVFYFNLIDTGDKHNYTLSDYSDADHLSLLGAKKFTQELDSIISSIAETN